MKTKYWLILAVTLVAVAALLLPSCAQPAPTPAPSANSSANSSASPGSKANTNTHTNPCASSSTGQTDNTKVCLRHALEDSHFPSLAHIR